MTWVRKGVYTAYTLDALIMVTQTPDFFLPSTSCLIHRDLNLSESCATFDVGLGCSGYPYGLWLASMMIQTGCVKRALVLHGETPSLITYPQDRATALLFGDAGSATALECGGDDHWGFHYIQMDRVTLISLTLEVVSEPLNLKMKGINICI